MRNIFKSIAMGKLLTLGGLAMTLITSILHLIGMASPMWIQFDGDDAFYTANRYSMGLWQYCLKTYDNKNKVKDSYCRSFPTVPQHLKGAQACAIVGLTFLLIASILYSRRACVHTESEKISKRIITAFLIIGAAICIGSSLILYSVHRDVLVLENFRLPNEFRYIWAFDLEISTCVICVATSVLFCVDSCVNR